MTVDVRTRLSAEGLSQVVAAFKAVLAAGEETAAGISKIGESEDAAAARIRNMVRASQEAQDASLKMSNRARDASQVQADAGKIDDAAIARNKAYLAGYRDRLNAQKAEVNSLRGVTAEIKSGASSFAELAAQEKKAAQAFEKGAIGLDEYRAALEQLDKSDQKLRASGGSAKKSTGSLSPTALTDIQTIGRELATGQFRSALSTTGVLAQNLGIMEGLMSPLAVAAGVAAAAIGLVAVAAASTYQDEQRLNQAIAQSGDYAGVTSGSFAKLASGISSSSVSASEARTILLTLVSSGKVSAAALGSLGQAAADMAELTGKSAEEASQSVLSIFDGTAASAVKADQQYHFLSDATYDQIKALEGQGRSQDAVRVAAEAFHDEIEPRLKIMQDSVYGIAAGWKEVKVSAAGAWEATKLASSLALGTANIQTRIYSLEGRKQTAQEGGLNAILSGLTLNGFSKADQAELDRLKAQLSKQDSDAADEETRNGLNSGAGQADAAIDQLAASVDKLAGKKRALADLTGQFEKLWAGADPGNARLDGVQRIVGSDGTASFSGGLYDKLKADIEKKYADTSGNSGAELTAESAQLRNSLQETATAYTNGMAQIDAARKAGELSADAYYQQAHDLNAKNETEQTAAINAEIDRLQQRKATGKEQIQLTQRISDLRAQAAKVEADAASKDSVLSTQRAGELKKEQAAIDAYGASLDKLLATRENAIDLQVQGVGQGSDQRDLSSRINQANQDGDARRIDLSNQLNSNQITQERYDAELAKANDYQQARVQQEIDADAKLKAARADWHNGATAFIADYAASAANVAQQTYDMLSTISGGIADAFANAATSGKLSIKSLADTVIQQFIRMKTNQALAGLASYLSPSLFGTTSSGTITSNAAAYSSLSGLSDGSYSGGFNLAAAAGGHAEGGAIHGPGTSTSDSIPARLSDGEFVMRAKAVSHYGLGVMSALNDMRAPRAYARGGYVLPAAPRGFVPRFANGGPVVSDQPAGGATVQVIDQRTTASAAPDVSTQRMANGRDLIKVVLREVASDMQTPGGVTNRAAKAAFGVRQQGVKRG